MQARSVSLGEMFAWIPATFRWFKQRFATLLGASALTLGALVLMMLPMWGMMFASMRGAMRPGGAASPFPMDDPTLFIGLYALTIVVSLLLFPPLLAGWFRLARDIDRGAGASALQLFAPYRDRATWGRLIVFALLAFALYLAVFGLFAAAFGSSIAEFMRYANAVEAARMAGAPPPPPYIPVGLMLGYFLLLPVLIVLQFVYMLGFAEVSLRDTPAWTALRVAIAGTLRNLLKLFVFVLAVGMLLSIAAIAFAMILAVLVAVLSMLSPVLGVVAMLALYVPFLLGMYPLMFGGHYFVWKDLLGDAAAPPAPAAVSA